MAFILPNLAQGGAELVTLTLIEALVDQGFGIDLVTLSPHGTLRSQVPAAVHIFDLHAPRVRQALTPLIKYLRARRPEAVHAAMWPLTIIAIIAAKLSGTKARVVVSDHSILSLQYARSRLTMLALRATARLIYPWAAVRVCVSKGCAEDLARLSGLPVSEFRVISNPIRKPSVPLKATGEVEQYWTGAQLRILTVGTLKEPKRHDLLIESFHLLPRQLQAKLVIVGEGECRAKLEGLIDRLQLSERVALPGAANDPWPYYASADLFVLSSDREGYGNVLVEALLAKLPIVSTDCETGPREILDGGKYGRLVPTNDAQALSSAIVDQATETHDPAPGLCRAEQLMKDAERNYLEAMTGSCAPS